MFTCALNKPPLTNTIQLSNSNCSIEIFDTIADTRIEWDSLAGDKLFMRSSFLTALEETPPSGTSYKYVTVIRNEQIIGILYYQLKIIDLYLSLRLDAVNPKGIWQSALLKVKTFFAKFFKANVLVSGNMALTGDNGFVFDSNIGHEEALSLIGEATHSVVENIKFVDKKKVRAILIKDFFSGDQPIKSNWKYTDFEVQPNMIMDIDPSWHSFDDYINSMKSKYRVRVRRARKKAANLERRILSLEEIHAFSDEISNLYKNVANQASFNLFILPRNYFYSLQKHLGDNMSCIGYFEGDRMVGFYTNIKSHGDLDAHFLGYDPECNRECQLYLNMLYDLVNDAIEKNAQKLIMSRTAMEIKSSVGAVPKPMHLYMRLTNNLFNLGVAKALSYFTPDVNWKPRSPFK